MQQDFEALLKEVVSAKRLSGSKMTKLTEMAMKSLEVRIDACLPWSRLLSLIQISQHDTQLVSALYRTHKSLPAENKISSLYVFDAVARAAKHIVNKQKPTTDSASSGTASSFLSKLESVLEGLFHDMQTLSIPEAKVSGSRSLHRCREVAV